MAYQKGQKRFRIGRFERGQAAVLAALCLFTMVVFVALASNVGMLASDRIRIQNVADASALAGAYAQAGRMNQVAELNANIAYVAWYCRMRLTWQPNGGVRRWNQCTPEVQPGDIPFTPPFGGGPGIDPPGGGGAAALESPVCFWDNGVPSSNYSDSLDPDAEALISWCQDSMNFYQKTIARVNNYATNYRKPLARKPAGGVRRAAYLTADTNLFKTGSEAKASRHTYIYDDIPSDRSRAFSPTWKDDLQNRPSNIPRFQMDVPTTGSAEIGGAFRTIPSLVDLDLAVTRFGYYVEYCDKSWHKPKSVCGPRDKGRVSMAHAKRGRNLFSWYGKKVYPAAGPDTTYSVFFPVKIFGTPLRTFFDLDGQGGRGYFGGTSNPGTDQLSAYAAAKPYDGLVGPNKTIGDDRFNANHTPLGEPVMFPTLGEVYSVEAIRELIEDNYFGAHMDIGPGGVSAYPQNQYRARLMGFAEEPRGRKGSGSLAQPIETVEKALQLRKEPGAPDKLPNANSIRRLLLH